jgi:hypothetical protein
MNIGQAITELMKREGATTLYTYPLNPFTGRLA